MRINQLEPKAGDDPFTKLIVLVMLSAYDKGISAFTLFEDGRFEPAWNPSPPANAVLRIYLRLKEIAGLNPEPYPIPVLGEFTVGRNIQVEFTLHEYAVPARVEVKVKALTTQPKGLQS